MRLPKSIDGIRVRHNVDGSFSLPRAKPSLQRRLDEQYIRSPGELRWFPRPVNVQKVEELAYLFGDSVYIVGKGPSLDNLTKEDFKDLKTPIFCINESIFKVEQLGLENPIIMIQQDTGLKDNAKPKEAYVAVSRGAQYWFADYNKSYVYNPEDYNLSSSELTVLCAIEIAKSFKVKNIYMMSFDACVDGTIGYAKVIGRPAAKPEIHLSHRKRIDRATVGLKVEWTTPKARSESTSDKAQLMPQHQKEHHAPSQS